MFQIEGHMKRNKSDKEQIVHHGGHRGAGQGRKESRSMENRGKMRLRW